MSDRQTALPTLTVTNCICPQLLLPCCKDARKNNWHCRCFFLSCQSHCCFAWPLVSLHTTYLFIFTYFFLPCPFITTHSFTLVHSLCGFPSLIILPSPSAKWLVYTHLRLVFLVAFFHFTFSLVVHSSFSISLGCSLTNFYAVVRFPF